MAYGSVVKPTRASYSVTRGVYLLAMVINNQLKKISLSSIRDSLAEEGLVLIGLSLIPPDEKNYRRLQEWRSLGYAAEMEFMLKDSESFKNPFKLHPKSGAIVSFLIPYSTSLRLGNVHGTGLIARYAWGRDYHNVVRRALTRLKKRLSEGGAREVVVDMCADAAPILERPVALSGGGFIGNNSMLIRPGQGSFFVIGEVFFENPIDVDYEPHLARRSSCGTCVKCISSCPTGAIVAPGMIDSRRCISYLTIEHTGVFTHEQGRMLGSWLFGCDVCQECCPFNHRAFKSNSELRALSPTAMLRGGALALDLIFGFQDDQKFKEVFSGTPLMRPGREGLIRNACAVAVNTSYKGAVKQMEVLATTDSNPVVSQSCAAALALLR